MTKKVDDAILDIIDILTDDFSENEVDEIMNAVNLDIEKFREEQKKGGG